MEIQGGFRHYDGLRGRWERNSERGCGFDSRWVALVIESIGHVRSFFEVVT